MLKHVHMPRLTVAIAGREDIFIRRLFKPSTEHHQNDFEKQVERKDKFEGTFTGKVSLDNWTITRRQRVLQSISFESAEHDIYDP